MSNLKRVLNSIAVFILLQGALNIYVQWQNVKQARHIRQLERRITALEKRRPAIIEHRVSTNLRDFSIYLPK
jgi:hypothetical protein